MSWVADDHRPPSYVAEDRVEPTVIPQRPSRQRPLWLALVSTRAITVMDHVSTWLLGLMLGTLWITLGFVGWALWR